MDQSKINRINELAHLAKQRALTPAEQNERQALRREYIDSFKASLIGQLENTYIVDENGNKRKVERKSNTIKK